MPQNYAVRPDDKRLGGNRSLSYGIRVQNPLPNFVRVEIVDGKTIIRETVLSPGTDKFIGLDRAGKYDMRTIILDRQQGAIDDELGSASFDVVDHQDVKPIKVKPLMLTNTILAKDGRWRTVIHLLVPKGSNISIKAVEGAPRNDKINWRLKVDGATTKITGMATFDHLTLTGGQSFSLQGQVTYPLTEELSGRVSGEESILYELSAPVGVDSPTDDGIDDEPVRSLADMFDEMRKKEVTV